jgi:hypothetical protein
VITTLLHEATHGMARTRIERAKAAGDANAEKALNDTSRQGRWHNARFRELAIEIGLGYDYGQDENGCACKPDGYKLLGWAAAKLTPETAERYKVQIEQLRGALIAHRVGYVPAGGGDGEGDDADKVSGTVSASCECAPKPHKIRVSRSTLITDPIICGACSTASTDAGVTTMSFLSPATASAIEATTAPETAAAVMVVKTPALAAPVPMGAGARSAALRPWGVTPLAMCAYEMVSASDASMAPLTVVAVMLVKFPVLGAMVPMSGGLVRRRLSAAGVTILVEMLVLVMSSGVSMASPPMADTATGPATSSVLAVTDDL